MKRTSTVVAKRPAHIPSRWRGSLVCLLLILGFALIVLRLFQLQVLEGDERAERARRQHHKAIALEADRGLIYDRQGKALALNVEVPSVYAMPASIEDPSKTARTLAPVLDVPSRILTKRLQQNRGFVWLKRKVDPGRAQSVKALSVSGVDMLMEARRFYPKGALLSHVLGFAGVDSQGLEGIEQRYESYLQGQKRMVTLQRDALGRMLFPESLSDRRPLSGHAITLTIDEVVQYIAEQALESAVSKTGARGGTVVVMEPKSGAILAWALRPSFDPNDLQGASPGLWRNRAVTDPYEPGSTMKVVVAAASLEEGIVEPGTLIYGGDGEMPVSGTIIHDHERAGWITFAQALTRSSNVAIVKTAVSLGQDTFYQYLRAFGFGERTEIDLPGESVGLLKDPGKWGRRTLASIAIGQEIGVTPVQLITAVSAIANGGWLMKPYVVSEIRDGQGHLILRRGPEVRRRPVSSKTAETLTTLLQRVVADGTGKRASLPGYHVAGKTGTAQKVDPETGTYSSSRLIGSFVGFVPAEDPRLAILVVIDEPKKEAWGSVVAAPVFRRVAQQVLRHLKVPPRESEPVTVAAAWSGGSGSGHFTD